MLIRVLVTIWLVPPALNMLVIASGLLLSRWYPRIGIFTCLAGLVSLWAFSTPYISSLLHASIERHAALEIESLNKTGADAIIVLGASHFDMAKEYGVSAPTADGLVRLHYAASLHHQTGLPILLTGGPMNKRQEIHSEVLGKSLSSQFGIDAKWLERKSSTTWQNAIFSAEILHSVGITDVLLVTHSYHMRRAAELYKLAGFNVIAAPTQLSDHYPWDDWRFWMPTIDALDLSNKVLHEYLGLAWYQLVSPIGSQNERDIRLYTIESDNP